MAGEPTYFEIGVPDALRAQKFYVRLFGWKPHAMGESGQAWLETEGARGGLHNDDEDRRIDVFFGVADIDAAVMTVRELGGEAEDPGRRNLALAGSHSAETTRVCGSGCISPPMTRPDRAAPAAAWPLVGPDRHDGSHGRALDRS